MLEANLSPQARKAMGLRPESKVWIGVLRGRRVIFEQPESYRPALRGLLQQAPRGYQGKERASWDAGSR